MAETVHLQLKANGSDIKGESTQTSLGRADTIECVHFESGIKTARETGSGLATGRRQHEPLLFRKRIDCRDSGAVSAPQDYPVLVSECFRGNALTRSN